MWRKTIFNMADGILTPCDVACGSGIVTVNSPSGSTLQCDTWLWDDVPWNSLKRPPYWNHHRCRHVILHQFPKFYLNRTTLGIKKWRHVDFQDGGSQPSWIVGICQVRTNSLLTILQTAVFLFGIFDLILDMTSVFIIRLPEVSMRWTVLPSCHVTEDSSNARIL